MPERRNKPRIPARCTRFLAEIDNYIHRYNVRGQALPSAAADVLDGLATRDELEPLVRRRLLSVIRYGDGPAEADDMCGWHFSVHLTPRAMNALWPDRVRAVSAPLRRRARKGAVSHNDQNGTKRCATAHGNSVAEPKGR